MRKSSMLLLAVVVGQVVTGVGRLWGDGSSEEVKEIATVGGSANSFWASPDTRHFAYTETRNNKNMVFIDGKSVGEAELPPMVGFSADSKRIGFTAGKRLPGGTLGSYAWIDGKVVDGAGEVVFSPDSKRLAYSLKKSGGECVVLDGRESALYAAMTPLIFSADSKRVAFGGIKPGGGPWTLIVDGQAVGNTWKLVSDILFSPDGKHLSFIGTAEKDGSKVSCLVRDGKPGPGYDFVDTPTYSPDSQHLVYRALKDKKLMAVFDGKEIPINDPQPRTVMVSPWYPAFSPDSKSLAYTNEGQTVILTDGVERTYPGRFSFFGVFSPDSQTFACCVKKAGQSAMALNGVTGTAHDSIDTTSLMFSADSKHLVYEALDNQQHMIVIDDKVGEAFDHIVQISRKRFFTITADGAVEYLAVRDKKIYRVHVPLALAGK